MPAPDTWSAYHARAAAKEAAAGHHDIAAICLRDARRAEARANLISYPIHIGGVNP